MLHWASARSEASERGVAQKDHMYSGAAVLRDVSC